MLDILASGDILLGDAFYPCVNPLADNLIRLPLARQQRATDPNDTGAINAFLVPSAEPRVSRCSGRVEPRAVRRRPKPFSRLMQPRAEARQHIREHGHPTKRR